jgi:hypothetical protein
MCTTFDQSPPYGHANKDTTDSQSPPCTVTVASIQHNLWPQTKPWLCCVSSMAVSMASSHRYVQVSLFIICFLHTCSALEQTPLVWCSAQRSTPVSAAWTAGCGHRYSWQYGMTELKRGVCHWYGLMCPQIPMWKSSPSMWSHWEVGPLEVTRPQCLSPHKWD